MKCMNCYNQIIFIFKKTFGSIDWMLLKILDGILINLNLTQLCYLKCICIFVFLSFVAGEWNANFCPLSEVPWQSLNSISYLWWIIKSYNYSPHPILIKKKLHQIGSMKDSFDFHISFEMANSQESTHRIVSREEMFNLSKYFGGKLHLKGHFY